MPINGLLVFLEYSDFKEAIIATNRAEVTSKIESSAGEGGKRSHNSLDRFSPSKESSNSGEDNTDGCVFSDDGNKAASDEEDVYFLEETDDDTGESATVTKMCIFLRKLMMTMEELHLRKKTCASTSAASTTRPVTSMAGDQGPQIQNIPINNCNSTITSSALDGRLRKMENSFDNLKISQS
ncbi:unnamed protein product [Mytilus edulis]|uniref:Uncharacterized protein n=1 Tax=Mytilus edulis TaxID=6550 RepID=A0A8S3R2D6_MYTED|nr:unnamed protein product [Mytilus edulis]